MPYGYISVLLLADVAPTSTAAVTAPAAVHYRNMHGTVIILMVCILLAIHRKHVTRVCDYYIRNLIFIRSGVK